MCDCCGWLDPETTRERRAVMRHLLLRAQAWWDAQRFDQPEWQVTAWREQKLRHIQLHVAKALSRQDKLGVSSRVKVPVG
jgi:hypothetical protein